MYVIYAYIIIYSEFPQCGHHSTVLSTKVPCFQDSYCIISTYLGPAVLLIWKVSPFQDVILREFTVVQFVEYYSLDRT